MSPPDVTVITPVLNRAAFVGDAIESVLQQDGVDVQHVVVDGGSTDGTLSVLAGYPHLVVLTGPDRGMYDAMNKGLAVARGDIVGHLNSDDRYLPHALHSAVEALQAHPQADSAAGGIEYAVLDQDGTERVVDTDDLDAVKRLRLTDVTRDMPHINTRFFRREVYQRVGGFDPTYRIAGDREFLFRACVNGLRTVPIEGAVYRFRDHPGSLSRGATGPSPFLEEHLRIIRTHLGDAAMPRRARTELRRWRAQEYGRAVEARAFSGRWREAAALLLTGLRQDPTWPVRFAGQGWWNRVRPRRSRKGCPCSGLRPERAVD